MTPMRWTRRIDGPLREAVNNVWPRFIGGAVFLYALGTATGSIKVGLTRAPRERFRNHWNDLDGGLSWAHLFRPLPQRVGRDAERAAHKALSDLGRLSHGRETFSEIEPATAIAACRTAIDGALATHFKVIR